MQHAPPGASSSVDDVVEALIAELPDGADLVVPIANVEPVHVLDGLETRADRLHNVRGHQMHACVSAPTSTVRSQDIWTTCRGSCPT